MFDEQPDGDPHGECAAEIYRLPAEVASYRAGNTALLEALMLAHEERDSANAARCGVLCEAGMLDEDGACNWPALEARKQKQQTWEQAVRECITDPAEVERLLALADDATTEEVRAAVLGAA